MRFIQISAIAALFSASLFLTGCYKKDLQEFKDISSLKYSPEIAIPFLIADITLEDTIANYPIPSIVSMSDTASIELPGGEEKDSIESVLDYIDFRIQLENSFPFAGEVQLYFADSNNVFIDSLLSASERMVVSGSPTPSTKELNILVSKERYLQITQSASKMYLFYNLSTSDITGLNDDYLRVKIGIKAKLNVNLSKNK